MLFDLRTLPPSIFDQMTVPGKPYLPGTYLSTLLTSTYWFKFDGSKYDLTHVDEAVISAMIPAALRGNPLSLFVGDIENWAMADNSGFRDVLTARRELPKAAARARTVMGDRPVGFYGIMPTREIWLKTDQDVAVWHERNDFIFDFLGRFIDFLAPSIYTLYPDAQNPWDKYADTMITEAKRLAAKVDPPLPICCYLWPRYNDSAGPGIAGTYIPYDLFVKQLNFVLDRNCHVILWDTQRAWNPAVNSSQKAILDVLSQRFGAS